MPHPLSLSLFGQRAWKLPADDSVKAGLGLFEHGPGLTEAGPGLAEARLSLFEASPGLSEGCPDHCCAIIIKGLLL